MRSDCRHCGSPLNEHGYCTTVGVSWCTYSDRLQVGSPPCPRTKEADTYKRAESRLERQINAARRSRDAVDEACRRAARLAIFEPDPWDKRYEDAWNLGKRLDEKIEALEEELWHVRKRIFELMPLAA
jgi:hypothetical protein